MACSRALRFASEQPPRKSPGDLVASKYNWPSVATVIIGARNEAQIHENLQSVGWQLSADQVAKLDTASVTTLPYPYWHQRGFTERNPPPV
jgi:diketogulonate reductase-like aldo/keto reductase